MVELLTEFMQHGPSISQSLKILGASFGDISHACAFAKAEGVTAVRRRIQFIPVIFLVHSSGIREWAAGCDAIFMLGRCNVNA